MKKNTPPSFLPRRSIQAVCLTCLMCLAGQSHGAITSVAAVTVDGSYDLTSVTIGSSTYTNLTGATATTFSSSSGTGYTGFWIQGTTPALENATVSQASSGLNYRAAAANVYTGGGNTTTFQFGRTITADDNIFILDFGTGDNVSFKLIDSLGATVGDGTGYGINIDADDFVTNLISFAGTDVLRANDETDTIGTAVTNQQGVSFKLSDFTGSGDISTATGFRISGGNSTLDPSVVGLATIPEPGTFALLAGLTALASIAIRRRRV